MTLRVTVHRAITDTTHELADPEDISTTKAGVLVIVDSVGMTHMYSVNGWSSCTVVETDYHKRTEQIAEELFAKLNAHPDAGHGMTTVVTDDDSANTLVVTNELDMFVRSRASAMDDPELYQALSDEIIGAIERERPETGLTIIDLEQEIPHPASVLVRAIDILVRDGRAHWHSNGGTDRVRLGPQRTSIGTETVKR